MQHDLLFVKVLSLAMCFGVSLRPQAPLDQKLSKGVRFGHDFEADWVFSVMFLFYLQRLVSLGVLGVEAPRATCCSGVCSGGCVTGLGTDIDCPAYFQRPNTLINGLQT
ncbi:unnamed protein product [Calypogeia fissa]